MRRRMQLQQLHIRLNTIIELVYCAIGTAGDMLGNRLVHALQQVLALVDIPGDLLEFLELLGQQQLVFELLYESETQGW